MDLITLESELDKENRRNKFCLMYKIDYPNILLYNKPDDNYEINYGYKLLLDELDLKMLKIIIKDIKNRLYGELRYGNRSTFRCCEGEKGNTSL